MPDNRRCAHIRALHVSRSFVKKTTRRISPPVGQKCSPCRDIFSNRLSDEKEVDFSDDVR
ncbi:hypothetical protein BRYFOR_09259 [Marvinbryantia formatexigens DSM 14469]|uniref:Uncharacterized protein n=1 Tax=Marvinbryantia formatexigens DSM 14469 TaxID=478749 RepID=C6LKR2_9FIRM|nr:hypothetical protein BRYFOR_09259 [Marvinbryantia formatexigens DSM 14469]